MLSEVIVQSPAKLNLHLKVHSKRADGYHDIESIFQAIDFCDTLIVTPISTDGCCIVDCVSMKLPVENTLTVAYKVFCRSTGVYKGVHVKLDKNIYSGAGLGGGSSNGAALIQALDMLFKTNLSLEEKVKLALMVGSDVPFFMHGGAAIVTGRGEYIRQIKSRNDLFFVVIKPDIHSSTKDAFRAFDEQNGSEVTSQSINLHEAEDVYQGLVSDWSFTNSFTDLLVNEHDCIKRALICLKDTGADFSQLSGSGSAVYGVFCKEEDAKRAYTTLSVDWSCCLARAFL